MAVTFGEGAFTYEVSEGWERLPEGWDHVDVPSLAVDADDRLYLFNRGAHPVMVFEPDGSFVRAWGEDEFVIPHCITVVKDHVYCVDKGNHCIRIYTKEGTSVGLIGEPGVPSETGYVDDYRSIKRGGPPFNLPTALAAGPDGNLYVTDGYGNARVHVFSPAGEVIRFWGEPGTGDGEFNLPHAIAIGEDGRVYVADRENNRIQIFDLDGTYLAKWADLSRPDDLAIGPDGFIYVVELGLYVGRWPFMPPDTPDSPASGVSIFDPDGNLQARWGTRDSCAPGSFFAPHGVAVDSAGTLYVGEANWSGGGKDGDVPIDCHTLQRFVRL